MFFKNSGSVICCAWWLEVSIWNIGRSVTKNVLYIFNLFEVDTLQNVLCGLQSLLHFKNGLEFHVKKICVMNTSWFRKTYFFIGNFIYIIIWLEIVLWKIRRRTMEHRLKFVSQALSLVDWRCLWQNAKPPFSQISIYQFWQFFFVCIYFTYKHIFLVVILL